MPNIYEVIAIDNSIKIYINETLHVSIRHDELVGFQSWIMGEKYKKYVIEFYTKTNSFTTEYNDIDKWKNILAKLDDCHMYVGFSQD